jgi:hypothetical protein
MFTGSRMLAMSDEEALGSYLPLTGGALTGQLTVPNGTAAAPGLAFAVANNTGIYFPGSAQIGFTVNGYKLMTIDSGALTLYGSATLQSANHVYAVPAGMFYWGARSRTSSPADGQIKWNNAGGTAGILWDFTTDALAKLRNKGDTAGAQISFLSATVGGTPTLSSGAGTPEGAVTAPIGSIFMRTDGGAATSFYVKESGTGNTGWVGK